jgi:hypothetical protein
VRKILISLVGALLTIIGVSLAVPAQAAGIPNTEVAGSETNTYISETRTVTDAGGQQFRVKVLWSETYKTEAGNYRVGVKVFINAIGIDLDTADNPGDGGMDATVKTYQGYADPTRLVLIQTKVIDGGSDPLTVDNANPLNRPFRSQVRVSAGVNDDGKANSPYATFLQPVVGDEDPGADGEGTETSDG